MRLQKLALVFSASFALAGAPSFASDHDHAPSVFGSPEEEVASLAKNLDNAIKVCTEESGRAGSHTVEIGKTEKRMVERGILQWLDTPPPELKELASRLGKAPRFGHWFDPHAQIWVLAFSDVPTCRILVGGSPWTSGVRPELYRVIQDDNFWKVESPEQALNDTTVRAIFYADLPQASNVRPMITIMAPVKEQDGAAQLIIGVHLVSKEKK